MWSLAQSLLDAIEPVPERSTSRVDSLVESVLGPVCSVDGNADECKRLIYTEACPAQMHSFEAGR